MASLLDMFNGSGTGNWGFDLGSYTGDAYASLGQTAFQSMGLDPNTSAILGAQIGLTAQAPGNVSYGNVGGGSSAPNTSGASNIQQKLSCWNAQNLLYATPADTAACNSRSSTVVQASTDAANKANAVFGQWWANLTFSGVITAILGVGMVIGALYLFGSASLSDAIANAVKGK